MTDAADNFKHVRRCDQCARTTVCRLTHRGWLCMSCWYPTLGKAA